MFIPSFALREHDKNCSVALWCSSVGHDLCMNRPFNLTSEKRRVNFLNVRYTTDLQFSLLHLTFLSLRLNCTSDQAHAEV